MTSASFRSIMRLHGLRLLTPGLLGLISSYAAYSILVVTFPDRMTALAVGIVIGATTGALVAFFASSLCTAPFAENSDLSRKQIFAVGFAPVLFGLYAFALGADANWDMYNYHLYAPFALLNDKLDLDLAVGGFQGYFNPTLDLAAYFLNTHLPPPLSGFLQGWFHGLVFIGIFLVARKVLKSIPGTDGFSLPYLIAIFGSLTANFMSEIGTTMGDNTTAVFILFGILLLIWHWEALETLNRISLAALGASGMAMGFATGLKITTGVSPIATCLALLLSHRKSPSKSILIAFTFGIAVLYGFALTGAPWMVRMWQEFGNPMFPQFGTIFPNSLALPMSVADTRWLPQSLTEYLLWPYVLALDGGRAGEIPARQIIWPILFSATIFACIRHLILQRNNLAGHQANKETFLIAYVVFAFVLWTVLFSIFRYAVAFELLAPLCVFILLVRLSPSHRVHRAAIWALVLSTAFTATNFHRNWGHEGWATPLYHTNLPSFESPEDTTVLLASRTEPLGWLATLFSPQLSFINLSSSFPAGATFAERVNQIVSDRNGKVYVLTDGEPYVRARKVAFYQQTAATLKLTRSDWGCAALRLALGPLQMKAAVVDIKSGNEQCQLVVRTEDQIDVAHSNQQRIKAASEVLTGFGFLLNSASCRLFHAGIGSGSNAYQICSADVNDEKS